jgi:thiosulfate dehydrogenase [quinone] large subunit
MKNTILGLVRILLGWTFVWSFFDKAFGLGFATESGNAWIRGGSPTEGFLLHATKGPFAEYYQALAGLVWVDWLFMVGLLLIGVSFMLNIFVQYSGWFAALLMLLMYTAGFLPPEHNPIVDEHIIYAILFVYFAIDPKQELKD